MSELTTAEIQEIIEAVRVLSGELRVDARKQHAASNMAYAVLMDVADELDEILEGK